MVISIPKPSSTLLFFVLFVLFIILGSGAYLYKDLQKKVANCVYSNPRTPNDIYLVGQVISVVQDGKWMKTKLALCNRSILPFNIVTIYSSVGTTYYKLGEKTQIKGSPGYHSVNKPIQNMKSTLEFQKFVVFHPDMLQSNLEIQSRFQDAAEDFVCAENPSCADRVSFFTDYGSQQLVTFRNIKNGFTFPFIFDVLSGKSILYGMEFGSVSSLDEFHELSQGNLL
jgi:hypothetical protein